MEGKLQTSFIPKKPLQDSQQRSVSLNIFSIIAWGIFIIAVFMGGSLFVYNKILTGSIETLNQQLASEAKNFNYQSVTEVTDLNGRIEAAKTLLKQHLVLSSLFDLLAQDTLKSIQFKSFNYTSNDPGRGTVQLAGIAPSFNSVALQSDTLSNAKYLKDQLFSDLALDDTGNVTFKFTAGINAGTFRYSTIVKQQAANNSSSTPQ